MRFSSFTGIGLLRDQPFKILKHSLGAREGPFEKALVLQERAKHTLHHGLGREQGMPKVSPAGRLSAACGQQDASSPLYGASAASPRSRTTAGWLLCAGEPSSLLPSLSWCREPSLRVLDLSTTLQTRC